ncbi:MAG: glycosyltransferase [Pseudomonadota bacterium]
MVNQSEDVKKPFFSIVIPTYNRKEYVFGAIKSVLNQTFKDFELIVVDDGSTDGTHEEIDVFSDERLRYVYQANRGAPVARNTGISAARGEYISFLDSDDVFLENKLARVFEEIQKFPTETILISSHERVKADKSSIYYNPEKCLTPPEFKRLLHYHIIDSSTSGLVIKRASLVEEGGFDSTLKCIQDRELLFRMCQSHGCVLISDILWQKNWTKDSIVANIVRPHYVSSIMDIADRNPSFDEEYKDALHYLVFRAIIKNLVKGNFSKVVEDVKTLKSRKKQQESFLTMIKDYFNVKKIRRQHKFSSS